MARLARRTSGPLVGTLILLGVVVGGGQPAVASDDFCPSERDIVGTQSDSLDLPDDHDDWWRHTSQLGYHQLTLQPANGDADLLVYDRTCGRLLCFSINGGSSSETCTVTDVSVVYVLVSYFGGGIPELYYTLTEFGSLPGLLQGDVP